MSDAHVHSLLHVNLNTADVGRTSEHLVEHLAMTIGMETTDEPVDGAVLGLAGTTRSVCRFLYDDRGPRTAPAVEVLQWLDPLPVGAVPSPGRRGIAALGFDVPHEAMPGVRDVDGVPLELTPADVPAPRLTALRLNVSDLDASAAFYERIGFVRDGRDVLRLGATSLRLTRVDGDDPPIAPANHLGLYRMALGVDDPVAAHAELSRETALDPPLWAPLPGTRLGGMTIVFLADPDRTVVELVGRPRSSMR